MLNRFSWKNDDKIRYTDILIFEQTKQTNQNPYDTNFIKASMVSYSVSYTANLFYNQNIFLCALCTLWGRNGWRDLEYDIKCNIEYFY